MSKHPKNKLICNMSSAQEKRYTNDINRNFEHTLTLDPTYKNPNILLKKCSYCELLESVKRKCRITALVIQVNLTDFLAMFSAQCTRQPKASLSIRYFTACIHYLARNFQKYLVDNSYFPVFFLHSVLTYYTTENFG